MSEAGFVILVDRCTMTLLPSWFDQSSIASTRKVFKYLFQEPWRNEDTIAALSVFLAQRVDAAKELWSKKSVEYQRSYRLPDGNTYIKRQNTKKFNEVKCAKTAYERYVKKRNLFNDFNEKR